MVQVEHRKRFAGEDHLVVVQPDGTLALIPAWMSEDSARSATLTASPRLAVGRLVELRTRIVSTGRGISSLWGVQFSPLGGDGDQPFERSGPPVFDGRPRRLIVAVDD